MDHRNSGLPELRILKLKSATADLSVSQRHPLAALAGRCGPVMTWLGNYPAAAGGGPKRARMRFIKSSRTSR